MSTTHGRYVNVKILPNGNLKLFCNNTQCKELPNTLYDLIDCQALLGSGWSILTDKGIGITCPPMIGYNCYIDEDGQVILNTDSKVWYFPQYQTKLELEELKKHGYVIFERVVINY